MKTLVTGGAGFIGSHIVDALLERGDDVRILDNFSTGDRRNVLHVARDIEIIEGDLRSFERVHTAVQGCDVVFHQAALPSVPRSVQDPLTSSEVNVTGTLNVLLAARQLGARRVVAASSSSVYGAVEEQRKHELLPTVPLSPYAVSKLAAEANARACWQVYGLETVSLRYFNVFGPRQNPVSEYAAVVPNFIAAALLAERPRIHGDGLQSRDFTFVDNVVAANLRASDVAGIGGEVFNIAMGQTHTVLELWEHVADIGDAVQGPEFVEARVGDVLNSMADTGKARVALGYEPSVSFREGLERTFRSMADDQSLLPRIRAARQWVAANVYS
jgi:UDP-glucose 4-epimerase